MPLSDFSDYLRSFGTDEFLRLAQSFSYFALIVALIFTLLNPAQSFLSRNAIDSFYAIPFLDIFISALVFSAIEINFYKTDYSEEKKTQKGVFAFLLLLIIFASIFLLFLFKFHILLFFLVLSLAKDSQLIIFRSDSGISHEIFRKTYIKPISLTLFALLLYSLIAFILPAIIAESQIPLIWDFFTKIWALCWLGAAFWARFSA